MVVRIAGLADRRPSRATRRPVRFVLAHKSLQELDTLEHDLTTLRKLPGVNLVAQHGRTCLVEGPRTLKEMRDLMVSMKGWTAYREQLYEPQAASVTKSYG